MYRITVKPISGTREYLTYNNVEFYQVIDGFLVFTDSKTLKVKRYAVPNCEIEEVD